MTSTENQVREILENEFQPLLLEIIDESHLHAGHMGAVEGVSTHFRIKIVSEKFEGIMPIKQHKLIYKALEDLMDNPIHALALKTIKASKFKS
jgi:BolA family transcriptional regulator, general stress-responsive regulator